MKHLYLIIVIFLLSSFQVKKVEKNLDFTFVSGTYQSLYGGVAGSGSSTTYSFKLKANRTFKMVCDSAFAMGKIDALYIFKDSVNRVSSMSIKKGTTYNFVLYIKSESQIGGGDFQQIIPGSRDAKKPKNQTGALILRYKGGKNKYLNINGLTKLDPIFAP